MNRALRLLKLIEELIHPPKNDDTIHHQED